MTHRSPLAILALAFLAACAEKDPAEGDTPVDPATLDVDVDGFIAADDCNDEDAAVFPGADELCNDVDDDCDGFADEDAVDRMTLYADMDGDGSGDPATETLSCDVPAGFVSAGDDCDDEDAAINPGATEVCDDADVDEDCSGAADDLDPGVDLSTAFTFYTDADADGFGDQAAVATACDIDAGQVTEAGDCDDTAADVNPAAAEICDPADTDEDCSGLADDADEFVDARTAFDWYADLDGDSYGDPGALTVACDVPVRHVADNTDCDDALAEINPSALELCDAADTDEDCDGLADDADAGPLGPTTWYADADGDGFGDALATMDACDQPAAYGTDTTDCDDTSGRVYPGAPEHCDGAANDCDTLADWTADLELGVASWVDAAGAWSEASGITAGTADAPAAWAPSGDGELRLCDGTYYAQIDGTGVSLTVSSLNGAATTVLDGGGTDTVLTTASGALTVDGVTVRNGAATNGGGIYCFTAELIVQEAIVESSSATSAGGGLYLRTCDDASIVDTVISGNSAGSGGGLSATTSAGLVLEGLTVSGNGASVNGGGLAFTSSEFSLATSTVSGNSAGASYSGGGVALSSSTGALDATTVSENTAGTAAGFLLSSSTLDVVDGTVGGNVATNHGAVMRAYYGSTVTMTGTVVSGNASGGYPLYLDTSGVGTFTSCTFTDNVGEDSGVFGFNGTSSASIVTSDFTNNTPSDAYALGVAYTFGLGASATCDDTSGCI